MLIFSDHFQIGPDTQVNLRRDFKRDFSDDNTEWLGKAIKIPFKQFMDHWIDLKNSTCYTSPKY